MKIPCGVTVLLLMVGLTTGLAFAGNHAERTDDGKPLLQLPEVVQAVPLFCQVVAADVFCAQKLDAQAAETAASKTGATGRFLRNINGGLEVKRGGINSTL
jgi:hypothetical protein